MFYNNNNKLIMNSKYNVYWLIFFKNIDMNIRWMVVIFKYLHNDILDRFELTCQIFNIDYEIMITLDNEKQNILLSLISNQLNIKR